MALRLNTRPRMTARVGIRSTLRCEVTLGESPARTGLEVLFEVTRLSFALEFDRHDKRPWSIVHCMARRAVIVPVESCGQVVGEPDVVMRRISVASQDVDDSFLHSMHAPWARTSQTNPKRIRFAIVSREVRSVWNAELDPIGRKCSSIPPASSAFAASPLRRDSLRVPSLRLPDESLPSRSSPERRAEAGSSGWIRTSNPPVNSRMLYH